MPLDLLAGTDNFETVETKVNAAITKVNDLDSELTPFSASSSSSGVHSSVNLSSTDGLIKATRSGNLIFYDFRVRGFTVSNAGFSWTINLPAGFFASTYFGTAVQAGEVVGAGSIVEFHSFVNFSGFHSLSVVDNRLVVSTGGDGAIGTGRFVQVSGTIIGHV
jgi:hypothetical protein